jgi:hypothetical protein
VSYQGEATFLEKDQAAQRVVIKANGKETRGSGTVAALVTAQLKDEGDATGVVITTDLTISGKAAQFGRGVLADVSSHLIEQFAKNLEADLLGGSAPAQSPTAGTAGAAAQSAAPQDNAINSLALVKAVAPSMAKRYAPIAGSVAAGAAVGFLLGRRKRKSPAAVAVDDLQAILTRLLGS